MLKCLIGLLSGINNKYFRITFLWIGEEMLKEIYKLGELTTEEIKKEQNVVLVKNVKIGNIV